MKIFLSLIVFVVIYAAVVMYSLLAISKKKVPKQRSNYDSVEDEEFEGEMEVLEDDPDLLYSTDDDD